MTGRDWVHDELPAGRPSAAGYRQGCRCDECKEAMRVYNRGYTSRNAAELRTPGQTAVFHNHRGRPSRATALKHTCRRYDCLDKAGFIVTGGRIFDPAIGDFRAEFD